MNNEEKKSPDENEIEQKRKAAIASERSETILFSEQKSTEAIVLAASGTLEESDTDKMEAKTPNGAWIFFETCGSFHKLCFAIAPQNTGPGRSELHQGSEHCRGGEHKHNIQLGRSE